MSRSTRAAIDRLELVAPLRGLAAALFGDEGELPTGVGAEHAAVTRPTELVHGAAAVVADEPGAGRGSGRAMQPLDLLTLGTPLPHTREVGHHAVDVFGRGVDLDIFT